MRPRTWILLIIIALVVVPSTLAFAQDASRGRAGSATLAEGWMLLAKGDAAAAALKASQELARDPRSVAALSLAVDADLVRGGASAALSTYEKWLGSRRVDAAYVLRYVARALLVESSSQPPVSGARVEALVALAADGDQDAASKLEQAMSSNGFAETRALAAMGSTRAVKALIAQLDAMPGSKSPIINALGASGSRLAVPPLKTLLADPNDVNRAAAAEALGRLGATDAVPNLTPLLKDQVFTVRLKAAGALYRLNDSSGVSLLMELSGSEHSAIRVGAAAELSSQPDAGWQSVVRTLTSDPDPLVRLEAARLIAPYDQSLANATLDALMRDGNIAIREAASGVLVERVASDFAALRALLHSGDIAVRVKAAGRILELTR
jgi:hypothetical protein